MAKRKALVPARENISLPRKKSTPGPGAPTNADKLKYKCDRDMFIEYILEIYSTLDFGVSSRGWAYLLETHGIITKGEFGQAQELLIDLRKKGFLPVNITIPDEERAFTTFDSGIEQAPGDFAQEWFDEFQKAEWYFRRSYKEYDGVDFWQHQDCFVMMMVEKGDLKRLFEPVCEKYYIPIASTRGWYDVHERWEAAYRFKFHESRGRQPIMLYCGDHDPDGLKISEALKHNFEEIRDCWEAYERDLDRQVEGWDPENLIVDRFGLNADFIDEKGLTWIDNLETGGGYYAEVIGGEIVQGKIRKGNKWEPHPGFDCDYVQEYLQEHGVRKCEANALVVAPAAGRELALQAINKHIPRARLVEHIKNRAIGKKESKQAIEALLEDEDFDRDNL